MDGLGRRGMLLFVAVLASAAENVLTRQEREAGWVLLFDGQSMRGWRDPSAQTLPGD